MGLDLTFIIVNAYHLYIFLRIRITRLGLIYHYSEVSQEQEENITEVSSPKYCKIHPMSVVEHDSYHVIVVTERSGVQYPILWMSFIP